MKKWLTLVLALVLVFSVAGSAFAFTGISEQKTSTAPNIRVKAELVDYSYGWKDGVYYKAPASRAYAVNEVVGVLVTVVVHGEQEELPQESGVTLLKKKVAAIPLEFSAINMNILEIDSDSTEVIEVKDGRFGLPENGGTSSETYRFFVTAQLKSDKGGSITAKVVRGEDSDDFNDGIRVKGASGLEFTVQYDYDSDVGYYYMIIANEAGDNFKAGAALAVLVSKNFLCKELWFTVDMEEDGYKTATVNGKIAFQYGKEKAYITSDDPQYSDLLAAYNELVDEFGFDYTAEGYLYKSFFTKRKSAVTVSDTAYVEPALPSSALVPGLSVTIPQTGSVSFAGFALIALAVAAAVAVKKAR